MEYQELVKYFGNGTIMKILLPLFRSCCETLKPWNCHRRQWHPLGQAWKDHLHTFPVAASDPAAAVFPKGCCSQLCQCPTPISLWPSPFQACYVLLQLVTYCLKAASGCRNVLSPLGAWVGCAGGFDAPRSSPQPVSKQAGGALSHLGDDNSEERALHSLPSSCRGIKPQWPPEATWSLYTLLCLTSAQHCRFVLTQSK